MTVPTKWVTLENIFQFKLCEKVEQSYRVFAVRGFTNINIWLPYMGDNNPTIYRDNYAEAKTVWRTGMTAGNLFSMNSHQWTDQCTELTDPLRRRTELNSLYKQLKTGPDVFYNESQQDLLIQWFSRRYAMNRRKVYD